MFKLDFHREALAWKKTTESLLKREHCGLNIVELQNRAASSKLATASS